MTVLPATLAALLALAAAWRFPSRPELLLAPLLFVALPRLGSWLRRMRGSTILALVTFLSLMAESGKAFVGTPSPFKYLGEVMFESSFFKDLAGLNVKGIELIYFGFAAWLAFKLQRRDVLAVLTERRTRLAAALALTVTGPALVAFCVGVLKGNDAGLAITQIRYLVLYPFVFYAAYVSCDGEDDVLSILRAIVAAMVLKSAFAWYVFLFVLGGSMGRLEYLIEHATSDHLATAMTALVAFWAVGRRTRLDTILTVTLVAFMLGPYILNDRRTSFIGLGLSLAFLPLVFWHRLRLWHLAGTAAAAALFAAFVAVTWNVDGPLGLPAATIKSVLFPEPSPLGGIYAFDYRDVENYNLYMGLFRDPALGMGLGVRFPKVMQMADVSTVFPLWDAVPHNNVLMIWTFEGPLGMASFGVFAALLCAIGVKLVRSARSPVEVAVGFLLFSGTMRWVFWAFGDLGMIELPQYAIVTTLGAMSLKLYQRHPPEATA